LIEINVASKENPATNSSDVAGKSRNREEEEKKPYMNLTVLPILWLWIQPGVILLYLFVEWLFVRMNGRSDPQKLKAANRAAVFLAR
jgi:hypothetical protein